MGRKTLGLALLGLAAMTAGLSAWVLSRDGSRVERDVLVEYTRRRA